MRTCASARISFSSSAASFRAGRGRRLRSRRALSASAGSQSQGVRRDLADDAPIEAEPPHPYVSRGGVKLAAALDAFGLDPPAVCLDVGASTGGFTDVLLKRGAAQVIAVDVGRGQLDPRLAADRASARSKASTRGRSTASSVSASGAGRSSRRELHFAAARAAACAATRRRARRGSSAWSSRSSRSGAPRSSRVASGAKRRSNAPAPPFRAGIEARGLDGARPRRVADPRRRRGRGNS